MPKKVAIDGQNKSSIESLIENYGVSDEPLVVLFPKGDKLTFQVPSSLASLKEVLRDATNWYQGLPKGKDVQHPLSPYLPETQESAIDAYLIHKFSCDTPKVGLKDACKLVAKCPWLAFSVTQAIKNHWKEMEALWMAELANNSKKNLKETTGEGSLSEQV